MCFPKTPVYAHLDARSRLPLIMRFSCNRYKRSQTFPDACLSNPPRSSADKSLKQDKTHEAKPSRFPTRSLAECCKINNDPFNAKNVSKANQRPSTLPQSSNPFLASASPTAFTQSTLTTIPALTTPMTTIPTHIPVQIPLNPHPAPNANPIPSGKLTP